VRRAARGAPPPQATLASIIAASIDRPGESTMRSLLRFALGATTLLSLEAHGAAGEDYFVMLIDDQPSGHVHTTTREVDGGAESKSESELLLLRAGTELKIAQTDIVLEAQGRIVEKRTTLDLAGSLTSYVGKVDGDRMRVATTSLGKTRESTIDWTSDVPGPIEFRRRLAAIAGEEGASFTAFTFDFSEGVAVETTFRSGAMEEVLLPIGKRTLRRVVAEPEDSARPTTIYHVDENGDALRTSTSMIGLEIVAAAATRPQWLAARSKRGAEVFLGSLLRSNVDFEAPHELSIIRYRLASKDDSPLQLREDSRQEFLESDGERLLEIRATRPPPGASQEVRFGGSADSEFLAANGLVQCDDERIVEFARAAIGDEKNAWRAAQKLESAIQDHVEEASLGVAFASASETFESRTGDCTEYAVLLAAACRAAGIPSRVAIGLVFVRATGGGIFGGHAWTEVEIDGEWYALDATQARGFADPTHITMTTTSLKDGVIGDGMAGIARILGNLELEVLTYE
jgi:transglutaminase-like putative cysteine protease